MKNSFDPERSLLSLPIVRWIGYVSIIATILFSIPILYYCVKLQFSPSGTGINYFALQFKVPLGILALGLALIGLCGANHRSEQTKRQIERTALQIELTNRQIELTTGQNNFSNYYKHLEEFEKHHKAQDNNNISIKISRPLHGEIFPTVRTGNFSSSHELRDLFHAGVDKLIVQWIGISQCNPQVNYLSSIDEMIKEKNILSEKFGVYTKRTTGTMYPVGSGAVIIPDQSMNGLYQSVFEVLIVIDMLFQFDPKYIQPPSIAVLKIASREVFSKDKIEIGTAFSIRPFEKFMAERIQQ